MKNVLITGATSGIGEAAAIKFAENNHNLIITGRRKERLEKLANDISTKFNVKVFPLSFDVRIQKEVEEAINSLEGEWRKIDILINNAGLAVGLGTIDQGVVDDWERMIDTNVKGLLYTTRCIAPMMAKQGSGHIINIGSIAGKEVYLNGNVYCATKHAVDALTKGMRIDLLKQGIKVSAVNPGAVETEFSVVRFKGDKERADGVYNGFDPLTGADIAEAIYWVTTLPKHVNINDLLIMPTAQANTSNLLKEE